jgi:hypothetical protein
MSFKIVVPGEDEPEGPTAQELFIDRIGEQLSKRKFIGLIIVGVERSTNGTIGLYSDSTPMELPLALGTMEWAKGAFTDFASKQ